VRETGIETAIKHIAADGTVIFGICGGYQMFGEFITDETGAEYCGEIKGIVLPPVVTKFAKDKHRTRVT
jgi:adenosylcobyric acid synthase